MKEFWGNFEKNWGYFEIIRNFGKYFEKTYKFWKVLEYRKKFQFIQRLSWNIVEFLDITADTVLVLTSITTVLSLLPTCSISANSLASVNALYHLRIVETLSSIY